VPHFPHLPHLPVRPRRPLSGFLALAVASFAISGAVAAPSQSAPAAAQSDTRAASAASPCKFRPSRSNTGARGELKPSGVTTLTGGETLKNVSVQSLEIVGSDVTIRNVSVAGSILVRGDRVRIRRVTAQGIGISSASNVSVKRSHIQSSPDDGIHITSDDGSLVTNVTLRYNLVRKPQVPNENHYDGTQVRGVDGLSITCSTYRAGRYHENFNAAIFLEYANGGDTNVEVRDNWLFGGAFSVMVDSYSASFTGNKLGGDIKWGPCLLLDGSGSPGFTSAGNTWAETGQPVNLCHQG
jgi:parallel beta helix pectate lyase-like protein